MTLETRKPNNPLLDLFIKHGKGNAWPSLTERYFYDPCRKQVLREYWLPDAFYGTQLITEDMYHIDLGSAWLTLMEWEWVQANMAKDG